MTSNDPERVDGEQPLQKIPKTLEELMTFARDTPGLTAGYIGNIWYRPYCDDRLHMIWCDRPCDNKRIWQCAAAEINEEEIERGWVMVRAYQLGFWSTLDALGIRERVEKEWKERRINKHETLRKVIMEMAEGLT